MSGPGRWEPAVKICGLTRTRDALSAARAGADFLGFIASAGFARSADTGFGREITEATGLPVVAVTVDEPLADLVALAEASGAAVLQLHGEETPDDVFHLRREGSWKVWKGLRPRSEGEVLEALERYGPHVDGLLLDGWHPELRGGSGARFPWEVVEPVRDRFPGDLTFVAAGGLKPENVADAVARLRPDVVDVSSGVEIEKGIKDPARLRAFINNAKGRRQS